MLHLPFQSVYDYIEFSGQKNEETKNRANKIVTKQLRKIE